MYQEVLDFVTGPMIWLFGGSGGVLVSLFVKKYFEQRTEKDDDELARIKTFPQPSTGEINERFYRHFMTTIADARDSIFITGDGFECATEAGTQASNRFHSAFRDALARGVRIVRVHTGTHAHVSWAEKLSDMLEEYPASFKLYALKDTSAKQLTSACVIDPEDRENSVLEFMFQTRKFIEDRSVGLAGTGIFIKGNRKSSNDICEKIQELIKSDSCVPVRTRKEAMEFIAGEKDG